MSIWDPKLGVPLPERSYAVDCALYTPNNPHSSFYNLRATVMDEFMIAHLLGWYCKYLMIRDARMCIICSILFELYELSFEHMLPNFAECWWDHIILDGLVCNGLGIYFGWLTLKWLRIEEMNWMGWSLEEEENEKGEKVKKWKCKFLSSFRHYLATCFVIFDLGIIELNAFFLKYILWTPPPHPLNIFRVFFWWISGIPGTKEFFFWTCSPFEKIPFKKSFGFSFNSFNI